MPRITSLLLLLAACGGSSASPTTPSDEPVAVAPTPPSEPASGVTDSGIRWEVIRRGTGSVHPQAHDRVTVHYVGTHPDGRVFDSSRDRGEPSSFRLDQLIAGWTEGVQLMVEGDLWRLTIPEELAYAGRPERPQGTLIFEIELLGVEIAPESPTTPPDVAAIPPDAEVTVSGLASRVLVPGQGTAHPSARSRVTVHYSGWTTDGEMFDSSITRGRPATFGLHQVIAGWTEGVQLMVEGEHRRFWIPENLAYGGRPGAPQGMLVFDVHLIRITP